MLGVIVTGHGNFATGLKSMIALVLGEAENLEFIDFSEGMGSDELRKKLEACYQKYEKNGAVVFADIAGGTPFNQAAMMLHEKNKKGVLGGVNIPILLAALELREDISDPLELCKQAKIMGIESITIFGGDEGKRKPVSSSGDGI